MIFKTSTNAYKINIQTRNLEKISFLWEVHDDFDSLCNPPRPTKKGMHFLKNCNQNKDTQNNSSFQVALFLVFKHDREI